jgi:hypothetical protein
MSQPECCCSLSVETSTRERLFHDAPGFRLSTFQLRLATADDLRLLGRQRIIWGVTRFGVRVFICVSRDGA